MREIWRDLDWGMLAALSVSGGLALWIAKLLGWL